MGLLDQAIGVNPSPPPDFAQVVADLREHLDDKTARDDGLTERQAFDVILVAPAARHPHTWTADIIRDMCQQVGIDPHCVSPKSVEAYRKRRRESAA